MKFNILLLLLFINLNLFGQDETTWKTHSGDNYSIEYPDNWELDESGIMGSSFFIFSSLDSKDDNFRENVNLMIQDLSAMKLDLDAFVDLSKTQILSLMTDGKILEDERMKNGGNEFHKLIFKATQGQYNLKTIQYYFIKDKKAYVLTLTLTEDTFEKYQVVGDKILNSFMIK